MKKIILIVLANIGLNAQASNFELASDTGKKSKISEQLIVQLQELYCDLKTSANFITSNIKNNTWVKNQFAKIKEAQEIEICTQDKCYIQCTYINRGKNTIIIAASGFGGTKERLIPYLTLFSDFDILLVNYWGKCPRKTDNPEYNSCLQNPAYKYFSHRWLRETEDIKAAVRYVHSLKKYNKVIGLARCYSTLRFCEVQACAEKNNEPGFDKLILDSPWLSMQSVGEKVSASPCLSCTQTSDKTPALLKFICKPRLLRKALISLAAFTFNLDFKKISIIDPISNITKCPILFIYGIHDAFVIQSEFEQIWNSVKTSKAVLKMPFGHSVCHLKGKEIYKFIGNIFIELNSLDKFCNLANTKLVNKNIFNYDFLEWAVMLLVLEYLKDEIIYSQDGNYIISLVS